MATKKIAQTITALQLSEKVGEIIACEYPQKYAIDPDRVKTGLQERFEIECSDKELLQVLLDLVGITLNIGLVVHAVSLDPIKNVKCFQFIRD